MTELVLVKHSQPGLLLPDDAETAEFIKKLKPGAIVRGEFKKMRNPAFHRKYMKLLTFAYDMWEPSVKTYKNHVVEKNFDKFRKDIAILSGFFIVVSNINGEPRYEAKSISFDKMDDTEFSLLYDKTITVIMKHILTNYTAQDINNTINELLSFT